VTVSAADLNTDMHASAEYRAHLIPVLAARAVTKANT
jgi:carbon-monoxide dehydrogenase medium subunit